MGSQNWTNTSCEIRIGEEYNKPRTAKIKITIKLRVYLCKVNPAKGPDYGLKGLITLFHTDECLVVVVVQLMLSLPPFVGVATSL